MSLLNGLAFRRLDRPAATAGGRTEYVMPQRPLQRVLAFRGRTIDDVINSRLLRNEVFGYWKLYKQIHRSGEIVDLEKQWNATAAGCADS